MKKILFLIALLLNVLAVSAQEDLQKKYVMLLPKSYENIDRTVKYVEGEVPYMFEEFIKTSLDYTDAIYLPQKVKYDENGNKLKEPIIKGNSFKVFLAKCKRDDNWEDRSLAYFCENFNESTNGIVACAEDCQKTNYEFVIKVKEVYKNGKIKVDMLLKDAKTEATLCVFECESYDYDDNDEIPLRDQMKSIGNLMGNAMNKIQKYNAKHLRKK